MKGEAFVFVPDLSKLNKTEEVKEEFKPVVVEKRKVEIKVEPPTNSGILQISFSDSVVLPTSLAHWSSENDGKDLLLIDYKPFKDSLDMFEEIGIVMNFKWMVKEVQSKGRTIKSRKRRLNDKSEEMARIDALSVQLEWT